MKNKKTIIKSNPRRRGLGTRDYPVLTQNQELFILKCVSRWEKINPIYKLLLALEGPPDCPEVESLGETRNSLGEIMSYKAFRARVKKLVSTKSEIIGAMRVEFAKSLDDVRLADPKQRLIELCKLYEKPGQKPIDRAKILKDIRDELSEDKWIEALRGNKEATVIKIDPARLSEVQAVLASANRIVDIKKKKTG